MAVAGITALLQTIALQADLSIIPNLLRVQVGFPIVVQDATTIKAARLLPPPAEVLHGAAAAHLPVATIMAAAALPEVQHGHPAEIRSRVHSTAVEAAVHPMQFRELQGAGDK